MSPPTVGEVGSYSAVFNETPSAVPERSPYAMTVRGVIEPSSEPPWTSSGSDRYTWTGDLRCDGWAATWNGPEPRSGVVELTGVLVGDFAEFSDHTIRGRVTRVQHVTSGVVVDLDLDDVPDLPPQPSFRPAFVSSADDGIWVLDSQLPRVVRRARDGATMVVDYPAPVVDVWQRDDYARAVHAARAGCWVSGSSGLYWVGDGGASTALDRRPVSACAVHGDAILACFIDGDWAIFQRDTRLREVTSPGGRPGSAVWSDGAFVVVTMRHGDRDEARLVRVGMNGAVQVGGQVPTGSGRLEPALLTGPLAVFVRESVASDVVAVRPNLTLGKRMAVPQTPFAAGTVGDFVWTVHHPPDGFGTDGWWPFDGPVQYDKSRGQFWMVTLLDRRSLRPVSTAAVETTKPSLAQDDSGTIWIAGDGQLGTLEQGVLRWPTPVSLDL